MSAGVALAEVEKVHQEAGRADAAGLLNKDLADPAAVAPAPALGFNVMDFGAKGNATTLDAPAIQAAIGACHR